ncbi:hypothetical protein [Noviherbaspirillum autotrophicum]|uniref:hypothetical protein n=1 Tax=Noviherbaspirillum autotrophicum TaxID=709839 RepID=UPI0012FE49BD|nr:hypothetical protein [Noviherbaspirillum autotrophicum]
MSNLVKAGIEAGHCKARYFTRHMVAPLKSGIDFYQEVRAARLPFAAASLSDSAGHSKIRCIS